MARSRKPLKVLLAIGSSRGSERGILRGIARYSRFHGPWILYREVPFYRKPPYSSEPKHTGTSTRLPDGDIDGLIGFVANSAQLRKLIPPGLPAVVLPIEDKTTNRCRIVEEDNVVGRIAAEHFLERGFTRFAFCGYDRMYWSRVRQEGFIQHLAKKGYTVYLCDFGKLPAGTSPQTEQALIAGWLKSLPKPIGLLACNDDRAQQVFEANKTAGMHVPDDVAILGVDNDDMICELTNPPLSSIAMNFEQVGYEAAVQLDRQVQGKKASHMDIYVRPTHIHTRLSTDAVAVEDPVVAKGLRFIRDHAPDIQSVGEVVEVTASSRRLLERHFRQTIGVSIYKEIQRVRIERACEMLVATDWSLGDIAERCGFSNPIHLSVAFKRQMKVAPGQYRTRPVCTAAGRLRFGVMNNRTE